MKTITGIFASRETAAHGLHQLRTVGVHDDRINVLAPGASQRQIADVPIADGEAPGMGAALGGVVGGAVGLAAGIPLGAAVVSLVIPGVGPIIAAGLLGAALFGAGGAAVGSALEDNLTDGLPHDDLFVYEDALRRGRTVVIVQAEDDGEAEAVRAALHGAGAESIDAAREEWWVGLREQEASVYTGDFARDESIYRRGFGAALLPSMCGRGYDQALADLHRLYPDVCEVDAFRFGFDRGQGWADAQQRDRAAA
jgi:hypothetical protein